MLAVSPAQKVSRSDWKELVEIADEVLARKERKRSLYDLRFLAELLYPPENVDAFGEFWKRFHEPQEWLLHLCFSWKSRGSIRVPHVFEVSQGAGGKTELLPPGEEVDLSDYTTLLIRQSRETLKTAIRRIDFIHDLIFYPLVRRVPAASAWFGHKLEMAEGNSKAIKQAMCASDRFFSVWGGIIVPEHRNPDKWGTKSTWITPIAPSGVPEASAMFLAVKTRYEGGRYKSGHFDDLVTGEDRDSGPVREEKRKNIADRENERDRTQGIRIIQGTDHHPQDAYQTQERKTGTLTVKLPCLVGNVKKFWDFCRLGRRERERKAKRYTKICKPVFQHLPMTILAATCDEQERQLFSAQMLLDPSQGGMKVFRSGIILQVSRDSVADGLGGYLFCDPAFKKPDNKFRGDYTAMGVVLWDRHGRRILVDGAYRNDWGEGECFDEAARLIAQYRGILGFYMEQKFVGDVNEHWQQYAFDNGVRFSTILGLERAGSANKMTRIKSLEPSFRSGRVVIVKGSSIAEALMQEADNYDRVTGPAEHDDALDMLSQSFDPAVGAPSFRVFDTEGENGDSRRVVQNDRIVLPGHRRRRRRR